jgi:hypothetical protein
VGAAVGYSADEMLSRLFEYIVNPIIFLLFAVALLMFIWGVIRYIGKSGDASDREQGQRHMLWGLIGLTIMAGAWGIVRLLSATIGEVSGGEETLFDEYVPPEE